MYFRQNGSLALQKQIMEILFTMQYLEEWKMSLFFFTIWVGEKEETAFIRSNECISFHPSGKTSQLSCHDCPSQVQMVLFALPLQDINPPREQAF